MCPGHFLTISRFVYWPLIRWERYSVEFRVFSYACCWKTLEIQIWKRHGSLFQDLLPPVRVSWREQFRHVSVCHLVIFEWSSHTEVLGIMVIFQKYTCLIVNVKYCYSHVIRLPDHLRRNTELVLLIIAIIIVINSYWYQVPHLLWLA